MLKIFYLGPLLTGENFFVFEKIFDYKVFRMIVSFKSVGGLQKTTQTHFFANIFSFSETVFAHSNGARVEHFDQQIAENLVTQFLSKLKRLNVYS